MSDENLFWSDAENGWVVGRPTRPRSPAAGRKRAAPDNLPHRLYERKGKRLVTWWIKDPDNRNPCRTQGPSIGQRGGIERSPPVRHPAGRWANGES